MSSILQKGVGISGHTLGLVWLCHVSKDHIHNPGKRTRFVWVPSILNHRNSVGPPLGQVDEVTARMVGEFNCVDQTTSET